MHIPSTAWNKIKFYLGRESTEESVPEMNQREGKVLVKEVAEEVAHAVVGPAAVDKQETLQVAKLSKGIVRGQHRLHPLLSADAHANVGRWGRAETVYTHYTSLQIKKASIFP